MSQATFHTSAGPIVLELHDEEAPKTVNNFVFLARYHYYEGVIFHRIIQGFMCQGGDPTGTGRGGPGYRFEDELPAPGRYEIGSLAMANAGPNTNGSQFFFVWKNTKLSPAYTPFGVVVKGMNVLRKIAAAGDDSQNGPGDGYPHRFTEFRHIKIIFTH